MRNGNISGDVAPAVGVRFEGIIRTGEGRVNKAAKGVLLNLMGDSDLNIHILTTEDERKAASFCLKWGIPYSKVIHIDTLLEIPDIVREQGYVLYYDTDREVVQNVNSRVANGAAHQWILTQV